MLSMAAILAATSPPGYWPGGGSCRLPPLAYEGRAVPARIHRLCLVRLQCADPEQERELVAEVGLHHLRAVRCDRECHAPVGERAYRLPELVLAGERSREEVRAGADLEHGLRLAE